MQVDGEGGARSFQPMNINFGLFPPIATPAAKKRKGARSSKTFERKRALSARALADLDRWLTGPVSMAAE